jgi:hypothetical protein
MRRASSDRSFFFFFAISYADEHWGISGKQETYPREDLVSERKVIDYLGLLSQFAGEDVAVGLTDAPDSVLDKSEMNRGPGKQLD